MSATSTARAYTRDTAGQALAIHHPADGSVAGEALARTHASLRPTTYRPSRPPAAKVTTDERIEVDAVLRIHRG